MCIGLFHSALVVNADGADIVADVPISRPTIDFLTPFWSALIDDRLDSTKVGYNISSDDQPAHQHDSNSSSDEDYVVSDDDDDDDDDDSNSNDSATSVESNSSGRNFTLTQTLQFVVLDRRGFAGADFYLVRFDSDEPLDFWLPTRYVLPQLLAVFHETRFNSNSMISKVLGVAKINDKLEYLVKWYSIDTPEYVPAVYVNHHAPQKVIEFYTDYYKNSVLAVDANVI